MKRIAMIILIIFLVFELYGCVNTSKTVFLQDMLKQKQENFVEFLNVSLCQDVPKKIKANQSIYFIKSCSKLVTKNGDVSGYHLHLYLPHKYRSFDKYEGRSFVKKFLREISSEYCNISKGRFGEDYNLHLKNLLVGTKNFDFYLEKTEEKRKIFVICRYLRATKRNFLNYF